MMRVIAMWQVLLMKVLRKDVNLYLALILVEVTPRCLVICLVEMKAKLYQIR